MAIQLYCGRPGSGKSYGVIENVLIPALKTNRLIYTNIPLHLEVIANDYPVSVDNLTQFKNDDVTGEWLMSIPGGALVIIDECWRYWPGGLKANDIDTKVKEFFAEHRHKSGLDNLTQEIVLLTQTPTQIAKVIRDLVDQSVLTIKNSAAGSNKTFNVAVYPGCIATIDNPKNPLVTGIGKYKPEIFKYYKSHTKSETGLPGIEIRADKRGNIWGHWYIRYVAPLVLISACWGLYYMYHFFTGDKFKDETATVQISTPQPARQVYPVGSGSASNAVIVPIPAPLVESKKLRIAAIVNIGSGDIIYLEHSEIKHMIKVRSDRCTNTINGYQCEFNGELVTVHTGERKIDVTQQSEFNAIVPKV